MKTAKHSCFLSAIIFLIFGVSLTIIGLAAKTYFPGIDSNQALFYGLFSLVPTPLITISVIALLAAIMSTIDTEVFYLSLSLSKDFFKKRNEKLLSRIVRFSILGITLVSALTAIIFSNILNILFGMVSLLFVVTPAFLASLKWNLKSNAVFLSLLAGFVSLLLIIFTSSFSPETSIITLPSAAIFLVIGQLVFRKKVCSIKLRLGS